MLGPSTLGRWSGETENANRAPRASETFEYIPANPMWAGKGRRLSPRARGAVDLNGYYCIVVLKHENWKSTSSRFPL